MSRKPELKPLTSLRFFFALAVFLHHCHFLTRSGEAGAGWLYHHFFAEGYIGVTFFFILSGFILAYSYQERLLSGAVTRGTFYLARLARIYPLHLLTLLLAIPVSREELTEGGFAYAGFKLLAHLSLTQSYWLERDIYVAYNSPSWSISDELFFYLLFPALILLVYRAYARWGNRALWLGAVTLLVPLLTLVVPGALHHAVFYIHPVARLADFFLGVLLYQLYNSRSEPAGEWRRFTWLETGALAMLAVFLYGYGRVPEVYRFASYYWLPMLLVIWVFAYQRGAISKALSHRWLCYLGEISFALYMVHRPLMRYYFKIKQKVIGPEVGYVDMALLLCIALFVSHLVYRYFEKPATRWVKSLS